MLVHKSLGTIGRPKHRGERRMFLKQIVFLAVLIAALTAAFSRGGRAERAGGTILFAAAIITPLAQRHLFARLEAGIAIIDVALLCALVWLVHRTHRRWAVAAAGFQALGVLTHFARMVTGPVHGDSYGHLLVAWSYFLLLSLLLGSLFESTPQKPSSGQDLVPAANVEHRDSVHPERQLSDESEHGLLVRLLNLHGLGPNSHSIANRLLHLTGSYSGAVSTPAIRLRAWGFDRQVAEALSLARVSTRTVLKRKLETRPCLADHEDVVDYLHAEMSHLPTEQFRVLYLNVRKRLIHDAIHGEGSETEASVFPREIIKRAIDVGAVELILAHNHPGGDPTPSRNDIQITRVILDAARSIDVRV